MKRIILLSFLAAACSQQPVKQPDHFQTVMAKLSQDAVTASETLAQTQNALASKSLSVQQKQDLSLNATYTPPGLSKRVAVDWVGNAENVVKELAKMSNYKYAVVGKAPANGVIVNVSDDRMIIEHLRSISAQLGEVASLNIISDKKLIEIQYAN